MTTHNQARCRQRCWTGLTVTAECLVWWVVVPSAAAQTSEAPVLVSALTIARLTPEIHPPRAVKRVEHPIPVLHRRRSDADAWERFDAEFRLPKKSPAFVKRQVETAKYGLDVAVFSVDRFVKNVRESADFHLEDGRWSRTAPDRPGVYQTQIRVKLDLDLTHGKPYFGARLVIPIGN